MKYGRTWFGLSLLLSLFAASVTSPGKTAPAPPQLKTGVLVLDNCDPVYKDRDKYEDNLSLITSDGKIAFRLSGLNNCESIGSNHMVASDSKRGAIWSQENVGHSIRKYDRTGKELLVVKDIKASALAVNPETGDLWVLTSKGTIYGEKTVVFDAKGQQIAVHNISGWDIAYDQKSKSFWIAGRNLAKVSIAGEVLVNKQITAWCAASLAVDPSCGTVWVAVRDHPDVPNSKNELLVFDNDGDLQKTIALGSKDPFHVSVDSRDGSAWLTLLRTGVQRYTAKGELDRELEVKALAAESDARTGGVWIVTQDETLLMSRKGNAFFRIKHKGPTSQAWIAAW